MSVLTITSLRKEYFDTYTNETIPAIDDVSFEVAESEFVSILGPSGCGKTTVLNIIAGFIEPSGGEVLLRGRPILGPGPDRGVVFQSFALFPWTTVLQNITFGLKMRGIDRRGTLVPSIGRPGRLAGRDPVATTASANCRNVARSSGVCRTA
ncbi:MAG: ATP-binding cassette domain-containing protein [Actinobacteria bacterium]|nr:ATP-binding cassette domain-containing protein [Actinomycetota bacterium]